MAVLAAVLLVLLAAVYAPQLPHTHDMPETRDVARPAIARRSPSYIVESSSFHRFRRLAGDERLKRLSDLGSEQLR